MDHHCHEHGHKRSGIPRPNRKLLISLVVITAVYVASWLPPLAALHASLTAYVLLISWAVALGFILGGCIDYFVPDNVVAGLLGKQHRWSILNAALAGLLMSACSHGILAIAIELHKKGAGTPAVITFLLASPWANLPMTVLLIGLFGWAALLFIGGALLIAIVTGLIYRVMDQRGWIEASPDAQIASQSDWSRVTDFKLRPALAGIGAGIMSLANMVLWWIIVGILAAALIGAYVPEHFFMQYLGPDLPGLLMTLLVASVIEVCSEGSSPIAFELFNKVRALGNPFVFLMAGVVTDYTEIGLLWTNVGRRTALLLPVVTVPQVIFLAMLFNSL